MNRLNLKDYNLDLKKETIKIKNELRKIIKEERKKIDEKDKESMAYAISERMRALKEYKESNILICYYSNEFEVSTKKIIENAWNDSKIVAIPKCEENNKDFNIMEFYAINSYQDIKINKNGFGEPYNSKNIKDFRASICVIPGLCFDYKGSRLGYGSGCYDKFLANYYGVKIGITYSYFMQRTLPKEKFDIKMDYVITEKFTKRMSK